MTHRIFGIGQAGGTLTASRDGLATATTRIGRRHTGLAKASACLQVNLAEPNYYSHHTRFIDWAKMATPIATDGWSHEQLRSGGYLDDRGNLAVWDPAFPSKFRRVLIFEAGDYYAGAFILTWDGDDVIDLSLNATVIEVIPNRIKFSFGGGIVFFEISQFTPGNHPRNISIVREDRLSNHANGEIWEPDYIDLMTAPDQAAISGRDLRSRIGCVRFMDMMHTNKNEIKGWSDYPVLSDSHWGVVPFDAMIELCNRAHVDGWWQVPARTAYLDPDDDSYLTEVNLDFATRMFEKVRDGLHPDLLAKFAFANEVWNFGFPFHNQMQHAAVAWGWVPTYESPTVRHGANTKINVLMAREMARVYGEEASDRARWVAEARLGNNGFTREAVYGEQWQEYEPGQWIDPRSAYRYVAPACYLGSKYNTTTATRTDSYTASVTSDAGEAVLTALSPDHISHWPLASILTAGEDTLHLVMQDSQPIPYAGDSTIALSFTDLPGQPTVMMTRVVSGGDTYYQGPATGIRTALLAASSVTIDISRTVRPNLYALMELVRSGADQATVHAHIRDALLAGGHVDDLVAGAAESAALIRGGGMLVEAYEGGNHMAQTIGNPNPPDLDTEINETIGRYSISAEHVPLYEDMWDRCKPYLDCPWMHFSLLGETGRYGAWMFLTHPGDSTPLWDLALRKSSEPVWWRDNRRPDPPDD